MKYRVNYISNKSSNTDKLANKPHESVARSILTILQEHDEIKHPVIGIEGSWGSGKSQVIGILEKMAREQSSGKKYFFHTYDIWSTQEDLTRRSFLDSLLNYAVNRDNSNGFKETNDNEGNLRKLNATTTIHSTKTFPVVRLFYGVALLIPLSIFLITMVEKFFGYNINAPWSYDELRGFISLLLSIFALAVFGIELFSEYETVRKEDEQNRLSLFRRIQISLSRILYLYKGKDIEKEDHETIIMDEPSVSRFKSIFDSLKASLNDNTVLVIVFDNMDRLSDRSKLMSVWTLLHTFFAECDNNGKIWAIVPYDKNQLASIIGQEIIKRNGNEQSNIDVKDDIANEFLNKTFFTSFHIPEPIMTSWKKFLDDKLNEAFVPSIEQEEKNVVSLIFSRTNKKVIRPRDIISFVNRLVTLYTQHQYEEIPLSALAIYSQFEHKFREDANGTILNHKGFESLLPLFNSRTKLTKQLASIYYNVKTDNAIEVVLGNAISGFLNSDFNSDTEYESEYAKLSASTAYREYIEEYFNNANLEWDNLKPQNLFYMLEQNNVSKQTKSRIYITVAENVKNFYITDFSTYSPWMEWAILNCNLQNTNKIINGVIELSSKTSFEAYQYSVVSLCLLKEKRNDLDIKVQPRYVSNIKEFLLFISTLEENNATHLYAKCNISIPEDILLEYVTQGTTAPRFNNNVDNLFKALRILAENNFDFKKFNEYINQNVSIGNYSRNDVNRIYKVYDIINPKIESVPIYTQYNHNFKDIPEYYAACIHNVRNSDINVIRTCFSNDYSRDEFIPILARYVSMKDMLVMAIKSGSEIATNMCKNLLHYPQIKLGDISYYLTHFKKIAELVRDDVHIELLYTKLDLYEHDVVYIDPSELSDYWIDTISKSLISHHPIFKLLKNKFDALINSLSKEQWIDIFCNNEKQVSHIIQRLVEEQLLDNNLWSQRSVCDAVNESYSDYLLSKVSINKALFDLWQKNVNTVTLAGMVNFAKDKIESPNQIEDSRFLEFVCLFIKHSMRIDSSKSADSFFDDYLSRFYRKSPSDALTQFTIDNETNLLSIIMLCSEERREEYSKLLYSLGGMIKDGSQAKELIIKFAEKISKYN